MKKLIAVLLVLCVCLLAGAAYMLKLCVDITREANKPVPTTEATQAPTTAPTTEPTTVPTTEPAPVYTNPLNGQVLEETYTGRLFACTISNIRGALPHVGVNEADIYMEMFVNGSVVRGLALFTDISRAGAIGSVRSDRLMFNIIIQHYDAVLYHAGGSSQVLGNANARGLDHINLDSWAVAQEGVSYRDKEYRREYEHSLFGVGKEMLAYAERNGIRTTQPEGKDYGLVFAEDGTPANGEEAREITVNITYNSYVKPTVMKYSEELGKYVYWQYDMEMRDQMTDAQEAFENVIIMLTEVGHDGKYQVTDFTAGGEGYYACGGKLIPIRWECADEYSPFRFFTAEGEPLAMGVGNTYIAITQPQSKVVWGDGNEV